MLTHDKAVIIILKIVLMHKVDRMRGMDSVRKPEARSGDKQ